MANLPTSGFPAPVLNLANAIMGVESGGDGDAVSSQGASGSMQIMPATFRQYAQPGERYDDDDDRTSAALRKINDDYQHFGGDLAKTAAAYIGGRGAVLPDGSIRGDVSDALGTSPAAYAQTVLSKMGGDGASPAVGKAISFDDAMSDVLGGAPPGKSDILSDWAQQNPADPAVLKNFAPGYDPNYKTPPAPTWTDAGLDAARAVAAEAVRLGVSAKELGQSLFGATVHGLNDAHLVSDSTRDAVDNSIVNSFAKDDSDESASPGYQAATTTGKIAQGVAHMAPALVAAIANPVLGAAAFAAQGTWDAGKGAIDQGDSLGNAQAKAVTGGAMNTVLGEVLGGATGNLASKLPIAGKFFVPTAADSFTGLASRAVQGGTINSVLKPVTAGTDAAIDWASGDTTGPDGKPKSYDWMPGATDFAIGALGALPHAALEYAQRNNLPGVPAQLSDGSQTLVDMDSKPFSSADAANSTIEENDLDGAGVLPITANMWDAGNPSEKIVGYGIKVADAKPDTRDAPQTPAGPADNTNLDEALHALNHAGNTSEALAAFNAANDTMVDPSKAILPDDKLDQIQAVAGGDAFRSWLGSLSYDDKQQALTDFSNANNPYAGKGSRDAAINDLHRNLADAGVFAQHFADARAEAMEGTPTDKATIAEGEELAQDPQFKAMVDQQTQSVKDAIAAAQANANNPDLPEAYRAKAHQSVIDFSDKLNADQAAAAEAANAEEEAPDALAGKLTPLQTSQRLEQNRSNLNAVITDPVWRQHMNSLPQDERRQVTQSIFNARNSNLPEKLRLNAANEILARAKSIGIDPTAARDAAEGQSPSSSEQILAEQNFGSEFGRMSMVDPEDMPKTKSEGLRGSIIGKGFARALQVMGKALGKNVYFYRQEGHEKRLDGFAPWGRPDALFLNVGKGDAAWHIVLGHEFFHQMPADIKSAFIKAIKPELGADTYDRLVKYINQPYLNENGQWEEIAADLFGNRFGESGFWDRVLGRIENPTVAQRLIQFIRNLVDKIGSLAGPGFKSDQFFYDLNKIRDAAVAALHEYFERGASGEDRINGGTANNFTLEELASLRDDGGPAANKAQARIEHSGGIKSSSQRADTARLVGRTVREMVEDNKDAFQFGRLRGDKDLQKTLAQTGVVMKASKLDKADDKARDSATEQFRIKVSGGGDAYVYRYGPEVQIDVSQLNSQLKSEKSRDSARGTAIYQAVAAWAHKNGYMFNGDSAGITRIGMMRRTENMISSVLRQGDSDYIRPHIEQAVAHDIHWETGSDDHDRNLGELLVASYNNVRKILPEIDDVQSTEHGDFEYRGDLFTRDDFKRLADTYRRREVDAGVLKEGEASPARISTITRAAITGALLRRASSSDVAKLHDSLLGRVDRSGAGEIGPNVATKAFYSDERDNVIIADPLRELSNHPDYAKAKAGDVTAAVHVVRDLVKPEFIDKIRRAIGDSNPIIQPVVAIEPSGKNRIPTVAAAKIAVELGLQDGQDIVQSSALKRGGLRDLDRVFKRPEFDGKVEKGRAYFLIDDTVTQGGTFAALKEHIENNGGTVIGAATLTGKQTSARLALSDQTLGKLREKYGDIEPQFQSATGRGFDSLTESEARTLANFRPSDTVRDRILAQEQSARGEAGADGVSQGEVSRSTRSPERDNPDNKRKAWAEIFGERNDSARNPIEPLTPQQILDRQRFPQSFGRVSLVDPDTLRVSDPHGQTMTRDDARTLHIMGAALGKRVAFYRQDWATRRVDGFAQTKYPETVFLNIAKASAAWHVVLGHEFFHQMPHDLKSSFIEAIKPEIPTLYYRMLVDYIKQPDLDESGQWEEIAADLFGNRLAEKDFWDRVLRRMDNPGFVQRLIQYIRDLFDKISSLAGRKFETDHYVDDLDNIRAAAEASLHDYLKREWSGEGKINGYPANRYSKEQLIKISRASDMPAAKARAELERRARYEDGDTYRSRGRGSYENRHDAFGEPPDVGDDTFSARRKELAERVGRAFRAQEKSILPDGDVVNSRKIFLLSEQLSSRSADSERDRNLGELLLASYNLVRKILPEIDDIRTTARRYFEYKGGVLTKDDFRRLANLAAKREVAVGMFAAGETGSLEAATIRRAAITAALLRRESLGDERPKGNELVGGERDVENYIAGLQKRVTPTSTNAGLFEVEQTGPLNYRITGGGTVVEADGYQGTTLLDAKYVGNPGISPYVGNSNVPSFLSAKILAQQQFEFQRYKAVIADPTVPFDSLNILTNERTAVPYFQQLMERYQIPGEVKVVPTKIPQTGFKKT